MKQQNIKLPVLFEVNRSRGLKGRSMQIPKGWTVKVGAGTIVIKPKNS